MNPIISLPWKLPLDVRIVGNLSTPDWLTLAATAGATIIGAIIGAGIAYLIAQQTAQETRKYIATARRDAEEAASLRAVVKIMQLINLVAGYHDVMERTIETGRKSLGNPKAPVWAVLLPMVGKPVEVHITADDLIAFTRSRRFDYITDLLGYTGQYNSMIHGIAEYGKLRDAIAIRLSPVRMEGLIGLNVTIPPELVPQIVAVSDLAERLQKEVQELYSGAPKLVAAFRPIVQKYFNDPHFPFPGFKADAVGKQQTPPP